MLWHICIYYILHCVGYYTKVLCGTGHFDCAWCILFFSLFAAVNNTRMHIKTGCSHPCTYTLYRIIYYEYNVYYVHNIATVLYYINMRTPHAVLNWRRGLSFSPSIYLRHSHSGICTYVFSKTHRRPFSRK